MTGHLLEFGILSVLAIGLLRTKLRFATQFILFGTWDIIHRQLDETAIYSLSLSLSSLPPLLATRCSSNGLSTCMKMASETLSPNLQQLRKEFAWKIWTAADALEAKSQTFYPSLTPRVVRILRDKWSQFVGKPEWRSLLDKRTLQHELEESIVAISLYEEQMKDTQQPHIVVDVCAGKGLYSFLLSYLQPPFLVLIVMIEKAAINWYHIHAANKIVDRRPRIQIWEKTNLHEYDKVLTRLLNLSHPLVLSGIHLCKQLGPAFCGLVNGLGNKCLMSCLAPCCLPRVVTSQGKKWQKYRQQNAEQPFEISIPLKEEPPERERRLDYMERRRRVKKNPLYDELCPTKGNGESVCCYFCQDPSHSVVDCSLLKELDVSEQIKVKRAAHAATVQCWNCLEFGHFKADCPVAMVRRSAKFPPVLTLDLTGILLNDNSAKATVANPFERYCHVLSTSLQDRRSVQVFNAPLESSSVCHGDQEESNWNKDRKACFIVTGRLIESSFAT